MGTHGDALSDPDDDPDDEGADDARVATHVREGGNDPRDGALLATERAAWLSALRRRSRHLITAQMESGRWTVVDGACARPGGAQRINDVRNTGRQPDVWIHPDRAVVVAPNASLRALRASFSWTEMSACEVLTDYHQRYWE